MQPTALAATLALCLLALPAPARQLPTSTQTVTVTGDLSLFGHAHFSSISDDGSRVAFLSVGNSSGTDTCIDVYVRDLPAGALTPIATCDAATGGPSAGIASLSGDGSQVAWSSAAPGGPVQVRAVAGGPVEVLSVGPSGPADASSTWPSCSFDGSQVAFHSGATNLSVPPLSSAGSTNVFVRDRSANRTVLISRQTNGLPATGFSLYPDVSRDGRFVAFASNNGQLVSSPPDLNNLFDVFVRDRDPDRNGVFDEGNAVTVKVSVASNGDPADQASDRPSISADGRFVAFSSLASNLDPVPANQPQIYVHDRDPDGNGDFYDTLGTTERVSVNAFGIPADLGGCFNPDLSGDGRYVAYVTGSTNLVPNDTIDYRDVFVHDRLTGQTILASSTSTGLPGNDDSEVFLFGPGPSVARNGARVSFASFATNLAGPGADGFDDVFAKDLCAPVGLDLGFGLAGFGGVAPYFTACGSLKLGGSALVRLSDARPFAPAFLYLDFALTPTPLLGGTFAVVPAVPLPFPTGPDGLVETLVPGGLGPLTVFAQWAVLDPAGPQGAAFSNALRIDLVP